MKFHEANDCPDLRNHAQCLKVMSKKVEPRLRPEPEERETWTIDKELLMLAFCKTMYLVGADSHTAGMTFKLYAQMLGLDYKDTMLKIMEKAKKKIMDGRSGDSKFDDLMGG